MRPSFNLQHRNWCEIRLACGQHTSAGGFKAPGMQEHTVFRFFKVRVFTEDLECEPSTQFQLKLSQGDSAQKPSLETTAVSLSLISHFHGKSG